MSEANAGAIRASIDFDANGLEAAVNKAMAKATRHIEGSIDTSMTKAESRIKTGFRRTGLLLAGFLGLDAISSKIVQAGTYIAKLGAQTEKTLNQFQAVSGATAQQMKKVSDQATQLGNDISLPGTSAATAAEAMTELAKAGLSVEESMAAAKGTLQLAAAAQMDAADAATLQGSALNAFSLAAEKAGMVADVLANSANASAAEIGDVGEALAQAGAVANSAGLSISETATFIAQFANAGIKGSDAGTLLKSMLLQLQAPSGEAAEVMERLGLSIFDANGNMVDARELTRQLSAATAGLTQEEKAKALATIFGADAIRGANVLLEQGVKVHDKVAAAITKEGAAAEVAAAKTKGLGGAVSAAVSLLESAAVAIYQRVSPAMDRWLRDALERIPGLLEEAGVYAESLWHALEPAARIVGDFIAAAEPGVLIAFKVGLAGVLGVAQALGIVLGPLADFIEDNEAAFRALVGPLVAATLAYKAFTAVVSKGREFRTKQVDAFGQSVDRLKTKFAGATTVASRFRVVTGGVVGALGGPWGVALAGASVALGIFAAKSAEAKAKAEALGSTLDKTTGAITKSTREWVANELATSGAFEAAEALGISQGTLLRAALGLGGALDGVNRIIGDHAATISTDAAALGNMSQTQIDAAKAAKTLDGILNGTTSTITTRRKEIRAATAALNQAKAAEETAAVSKARLDKVERQLHGAVDTTSRSLNNQRRAALGTKAAIQALKNEAIKGINAQIDFEQASDDLRKQIKALAPAAIRSGKALDVGTQAGRDTYRAFIALATASVDVEGGMKRARQQIYNTIRPMVDSDRQAWKLTDQFFKLKNAASNADKGKVSIPVSAPGLDMTYAKLVRLDGLYKGMDGDVVRTHIINTTTHITERLKRAAGGPVFGPGTGTSDSIPALLSNNEHVWTAAEVEAAGGHGAVMALRKAALSGARFRDGGAVGYQAKPVGTSVGSGALVDNLTVEVGTKEDLPEALDETLFHLRRIRRGGRYAADLD